MIRSARVGYHPVNRHECRETWGLKGDGPGVWLPRGLVFPWWFGQSVWRVIIRRPVKVDDPSKYVAISGSANLLYRIETVRPRAPAMIVEGVLDALAITQEAGDVITAVAAGSTTGGRRERWIGRLGLASLVLVSFDADDGGEAAAAWWLKALGPRAKRWRPYWDDPSTMLQVGADLRLWVRAWLGQQPPYWQELVNLPAEQRAWWEERVAILEVESALPRQEAEAVAFAMLKGATWISPHHQS
jgi:hypothetical protein